MSSCGRRAVSEDPRLARWVDALLSTPGLTSLTDRAEAWRSHIDDALAAADLLEAGPVVDVGSGGGSPGIPLAAARPDLHFVLLESNRRRCAFLEATALDFPNVSVVNARAEEHGLALGREAYAVALARALAPPPVALEWCLPLVRVGGLAVLYAGDADLERAAAVAAKLGGSPPLAIPMVGSQRRKLVVVRKDGSTPLMFPRRPGMARKRPLA
jgi:16S rRNA (guanine527-N7)-methyltransferase